MSITEIILLALSLAMDCFTVSIAAGVILKRIEWRTMTFMSLMFGLFQGLMPLMGWALASRLSHLIGSYDHWIAFGLLLILGVRMIIASFSDEEESTFNPRSLSVIFTLAVATSIDALAVGITFAFTDIRTIGEVMLPVTVIGAVSFLLSMAGSSIGALFGRLSSRLRMEFFGGLVLIAIGIKILVEHMAM